MFGCEEVACTESDKHKDMEREGEGEREREREREMDVTTNLFSCTVLPGGMYAWA